MFRFLGVFVLALTAVNAEAQVDKSFAELFNASRSSKSIRPAVKQRQKRAVSACDADIRQLRTQLDSTRRSLAGLHEPQTRSAAHEHIASLERSIQSQNRECDHDIPSQFAIELAKVQLAERWPRQRERTRELVEKNKARIRRHGDVEDIGYRNIGGGLEGQLNDVSTGEKAVRQMKNSGMMPSELEDSGVQRHVQSLARHIASSSDLRIPLHVSVLDSNDIDAVGLPGGFLFVTSGLLHACESDDELAGVLAREIAHIAARHAARNSKRSVISKLLVPAARVATGFLTGGAVNAGTYYGLNYGLQGLQSIVDRSLVGSGAKEQREADQLGIQYAWNAGYDPKGFIMFLDSLVKQREYSRSESWFELKPSLESRMIDAYSEIEYLPMRTETQNR